MSPATCGKIRRGRGSSTVTHSHHGRHPDQVPSYGYTGNVSRSQCLLCRKLTVFPFRKRAPARVFFGTLTVRYLHLRELTVLGSSTVIKDIENMRKSGLASLAMFYHDFREDGKKDFRGLLSSILFQLCAQSDSYYDILASFHSTHCDGAQSPGNDELFRCLKAVLSLPGQPPVYLIVDALDECLNSSALWSPRLEVLTLLENLVDSRLPNLRICVTSQPESDIQAILGPLTSWSVSLHSEQGQMEDIEHYIKSVVNTNRNM